MNIPPSLVFAVLNKVGRMVFVKKSANGDKLSGRDISVVKIVVLLVAAVVAYFVGGADSAISILSNIGVDDGSN